MKKNPFDFKNMFLFEELMDDDFSENAGKFEREQLKKYNQTFKHLNLVDINNPKLFKIPPPRASDARWVLPGEKIVFGNYKITAGFFYFGTSLPSERDDARNFASLINPNISIPKKKKLDPKQSMIPGAVDYAELTGIQRRKYVLWHSGGRIDKNTHEWFAMLFLYGLERRIFIDGLRGLVKPQELLQIRDEVRRILTLYGGRSTRINFAYSNFLACLEIECGDHPLYSIPFPYFECKRYDDSFNVFSAYINTALSQCAEDGAVVNSELAYYWYILSGDMRRNSTAVKCMDVFKRLFMIRYTETYEKGLLIKKTKKSGTITAEFCYEPKCPELDKAPLLKAYRIAFIFGEAAHINKLEEIAARCGNELEFYARRLAKHDTAAAEISLALPPVLWAGGEAEAFKILKKRLNNNKKYFMELHELKNLFFKTVPFSKYSLMDLACALETENIAMEPDIISFPGLINDKFLFHILKNKIPKCRSNANYELSRMILELAVSAHKLCAPEEKTFRLYYPIKLDEYFFERLSPYIYLMVQDPPPFQQCVNRLKKLSVTDKKSVIKYIQEEILKDRSADYEAVSVIEKMYKGFGLSEKDLYNDLHSGGASTAAKNDAAKSAAVHLDKNKIKQLRKDSDHVYNLLSDIFKDDETEENAGPKTDSKETPGNYFGFDEAQTLFLKTVISRAEWPRDELMEDAKRNGLMLDGFMEIVNEAAYNEFDEALMEGDETITVNMDIAGMMTEKL
ncbi:MAG: TerB N-terminal domain-containing protein [Spirochaetaceae bacterium]|nr:TerB N-terminal domain-containing protein [Spirochaetaceae bacterium]